MIWPENRKTTMPHAATKILHACLIRYKNNGTTT